ncbi:MAG: DUF1512 family protein [Candidatus Aenigmatarchaeota archaeon]
MAVLFQFGGDIWSNIIWLIILLIFFNFYPRLMVSQLLWKLERSALMLENLTNQAKNIVIKKISKKPEKSLKEKVNNFLEFFMIEPVSLDPYGIIKKLEHVSNLSEEKFKVFVKDIASKLDKEEQANLVMGLSGAITLNQLSKLVRHYVEMVRKTKNLQLGMVLEMQLPLIERISKSLLKGTEALTNGWPIGDSVGPIVAARLIGNNKVKEMEEDVVVAEKKIKGRQVIIMKAKGPGGRLGKLGRAVEKLVKKKKISKIITIDAAAKLEGEKTGKIAEGVGVAIGGIGVDRAYIEELATKKKIPLDSIVIKMSQEEAIQPIPEEVLKAVSPTVETVEKNIEKSKGRILVVGVGNTCGVGNNAKSAEQAEIQARKILKMLKRREEAEKKGFWDWI